MSLMPESENPVLVAGAGGFIGGHLVRDLLRKGHSHVRAVDIKPPGQWHQCFPEAENWQLDLRGIAACHQAVAGARTVYNLAADTGGMGFLENHRARCMLTVLLDTHLLLAAREAGVARYHNVYGPHDTFRGDREKGPAVLCRKVIEAKLSGSDEIEIWGGRMPAAFVSLRR